MVNSIDSRGRYAYKNQPGIAVLNLSRFAETLLPLLEEDVELAVEIIEEALTEFETVLDTYRLKESHL